MEETSAAKDDPQRCKKMTIQNQPAYPIWKLIPFLYYDAFNFGVDRVTGTAPSCLDVNWFETLCKGSGNKRRKNLYGVSCSPKPMKEKEKEKRHFTFFFPEYPSFPLNKAKSYPLLI
jgi:hypothetical protein